MRIVLKLKKMAYIDLYLFAVEYYIVNNNFLTQDNIFAFL